MSCSNDIPSLPSPPECGDFSGMVSVLPVKEVALRLVEAFDFSGVKADEEVNRTLYKQENSYQVKIGFGIDLDFEISYDVGEDYKSVSYFDAIILHNDDGGSAFELTEADETRIIEALNEYFN